MPKDRWQLRRVRLWDGQEIDLSFCGLALGGTTAKNGLAAYLYLVGKGLHFTIIGDNGRLTVHTTDEKTGVHKNLLAFDLNRAISLLEPDSSLLAELRNRVNRICFHISRPEHLESIGAKQLLPVPITQHPIDSQCDSLDISSLAPVPVPSAWQTDTTCGWAVFDSNSSLLGILISGWFGKDCDILFFPWREIIGIAQSFMTELVDPTGRAAQDLLADLLAEDPSQDPP